MAKEQKSSEPKKRDQEQKEQQSEDLQEKGEDIEERLDELDELIDEALDEEEVDMEEAAQKFVDGFKQEGGE